jgi:hypothetical protein
MLPGLFIGKIHEAQVKGGKLLEAAQGTNTAQSAVRSTATEARQTVPKRNNLSKVDHFLLVMQD